MKILMCTAEAKPYCKTGGLGDVAFALANELSKKGHKTDIIVPYYKMVKEFKLDCKKIMQFEVYTNYQYVLTNIYKHSYKGVNFIFVEQNNLFDRDKLYGYQDDIFRFSAYSLAVLMYLRHKDVSYDVIHCNDWQTGMIPLLVKLNNVGSKTLLTIHNPVFMGFCDKIVLKDYFNIDMAYFYNGTCRFNDSVSFLKSGIMTADKVNTVSRTHAKELTISDESFYGLGSVLRLRQSDFSGIVNGLDKEFDPKIDEFLPIKYSYQTLEVGKFEAFKELANILQIKHNYKIKPLVFGVVSRLTSQKGIDKIAEAAPLIALSKGILFVVGSGEVFEEDLIKKLKNLYPDNIYFYNGYSDKVAHLVYACSDFFLMPSLFEPCGTSQMISLKYGTLPIASNAGGLNDTIKSYPEENLANGFVYNLSEPFEFSKKICDALSAYEDKKVLKKLIKQAMQTDNSWNKSVEEYISLYKSL